MAGAKLSKERLVTLRNEIKMSEKFNHEELEPIMAENLQRYTGHFTPSFGRGWDILLNEVYPIVQNNLPSTFFRNPRAFLKPRNKTYITKKRNLNSGVMEEVQADSSKSARTQEAILNYLLQEIKYKKQTRKVLLDGLLFPYGVLWHGYKGDFGMTEEQSLEIKDDKIFAIRTSPMRFIYDPSVSINSLNEGKWVGRILDIPLIDILEDTKLDVDPKFIKGKKGFSKTVGTATAAALKAIQSMPQQGTDIASTASLKKALIDFADEEFRQSKAARFVRLYEIFLRPTKKERRDGKKGFIVLLTEEQPKPLRVNDWRIKAEGFPSKILEFNELPDHPFGLPDIQTYRSIVDQKNIITNLQIRNAQQHSKVWVGISKEGMEGEEQIEKIQQGANTIILFPSGNPRDRMYVASPGGQGSSELYIIDQRIQKNLEDKSGVTDLKRGFLQSGEESAASVKIRAAGGSARPAYRQDIMADFLKESLLYLNQLTKQFTPIKEAVRIIGSLDLEWSENPSKEELQADIDVELDVISMLPENPEKEIRELNTILALMIQGLTIPEVRAKIEQEGKTINISPIIEQILLRMRMRDPEIFRTIRPEESQGFVSVQQLREAKQNVQAALQGKPIPFPPTMEDDHRAKLETYTSITQVLQAVNQVSAALNQLIQIHTALLQKLQEQEAKPGQGVPKLPQPKVSTVGTL